MDRSTRFFWLLLVVLGLVATLIVLPLLQYVLAAALLAFVLYPAHKRLEPRIGTKRSAFFLTAGSVIGIVVPLVVFSIVMLQTVISFLDEFDGATAIDNIRDLTADLGINAETITVIENQLRSEFEGVITDIIELALLETVGLVNRSIQMGIGILVLVFLLYYLLADGELFIAWLRDVFPLADDVRDRLFEEVDTVTWAVIKSHVLVALIEGVLGGIGLYLLGVPNAAFWTIIMIIVSFLPAIGIWLVWGPAVVYLLVVDQLFSGLLLLLYGIVVLSVVDNYLRALFVDKGSGLHPAVVLVGVIGGIYLLGIMGLFLGPVLLAAFKAGMNVFSDTEFSSG